MPADGNGTTLLHQHQHYGGGSGGSGGSGGAGGLGTPWQSMAADGAATDDALAAAMAAAALCSLPPAGGYGTAYSGSPLTRASTVAAQQLLLQQHQLQHQQQHAAALARSMSADVGAMAVQRALGYGLAGAGSGGAASARSGGGRLPAPHEQYGGHDAGSARVYGGVYDMKRCVLRVRAARAAPWVGTSALLACASLQP
jgi:hypothetical protein